MFYFVWASYKLQISFCFFIGLNRYNNQPVSNPKNNVILTRNRMLSIYVMVGALD